MQDGRPQPDRLMHRVGRVRCGIEAVQGGACAREIDKMIGWGAPVPPEMKSPLLEYLVNEFSNPETSPVAPPERITFRAALALSRPEGRLLRDRGLH